MKTFAPSRRFSQNFLTDPRTAQKIVDALEVRDGDVVFEIGPGKGVLTERLLQTAARVVVAVDLDPRAIQYLHDQPWADTPRLRLVVGDAMQQDLSAIAPKNGRLLVIGNIPYAITTPILFMLFEQRTIVHRAVVMMQREVAHRCVAMVGSKDYGILAVATWYASTAKTMFTVPPGAFFPKPAVTSAVVRFDMRSTDPLPTSFAVFMDFVRSAFSQRRKVLANALASWSQRIRGCDIRERGLVYGPFDLGRLRAEELSPEQLEDLRVQIVSGGTTET